ncbi:DUF4214 domain-containing protein [Ramlibacter sp. PS4R-6]|uniref:DUF4214 domain-containing protein n=1 Tax=Ramlibacter sp. PS4R-6 TaxID=3133438 RepID=UPI003099BB29
MKRIPGWLAPVVVQLGLLSACGGGEPPAAPSADVRMAATAAIPTFSGKRNSYNIEQTASGYTVSQKVGSTSTQVPAGTASVAFSDYTVNLGVGANAAALSQADLQLLVELYIAFFNRVPDADGLSYWIGQFRAGRSIDTIADNFYGAAVQFSSVTGYSAGMSNADFVRIIYKNVLGRTGASAPPDADVNYWANRLDTHTDTRGSLIRVMLGSAHTFKGDATWGKVANLLDNKFAVGFYFAVQQGLNYNSSSDNITRGAAIAAAVTATSTTSARTLVGVTDPSFALLTLAPGAPTLVTATAGEGKATVTFAAPAFDGGSAVTGYSASCTGGGITRTATGTTKTIVVSDLTGGTTYACTAAAKNAIGTGASSAAVSITTPGSNASGIYGFLTDGAVMGVRFACGPSNVSGMTDLTGRFQCDPGDATAAFSIDARNGAINLGSANLPQMNGLPLFVSVLELNGTAVGLKTAEILHALDHGTGTHMDVSSIVLPAAVIQEANAFIANPYAPPAGYANDDVFLAHLQTEAAQSSGWTFRNAANPLGNGQAFVQDVVLPHVADTFVRAAAELPRPVVGAGGSTRLAGTIGVGGSVSTSVDGASVNASWQGGGVINMVVQGDITQPGAHGVNYSTPGMVVGINVVVTVPGFPTQTQRAAVNTPGLQGNGTITVTAGFGGNSLTLPVNAPLPAGCSGTQQFTGTDVGLSNPMITMSMPMTCSIDGVTVTVTVTMKLVGAP